MVVSRAKQANLLLAIYLMTPQILSASPTTAATMSTPHGDTTIPPTPSPTSLTTSTTPPSTRLPEGRCEWEDWKGSGTYSWGCSRPGFSCIDYVCTDTRTWAQIEADKHALASGKDGRCLLLEEMGKYTCKQGFECDEQLLCVDKRTPEQKAEDERNEKRKAEKSRTKKLVGAIVGSTMGAAVLLCMTACCVAAGRHGSEEQRKAGLGVDGERLRYLVEVEVRKQRAAAVTPLAEAHVSNGGAAATAENEQAAPPAYA